MRIALLYDDVHARPTATPDEAGVVAAVEAIQMVLRDLGHRPVRVPVGPGLLDWSARLHDASPELVFNLCEGVGGISAHEVRVAASVELLDLRMTGAPSETLALARRKDRVNAILAGNGLPVPEWTLVRTGDALPAWHRYPAIVKPAAEDASVGITQRSVARDRTELAGAVDAAERHRPLLIQAFLPGRELVVGIVGRETLPITEIEFGGVAHDHWPLVTYGAKWEAGSAEDHAASPRCPAPLDEPTRREALALARAAWASVDGRGYGRVDLRADARSRLHVLDVNPNPDLAPAAGLAHMAAAHGWSYAELMTRILHEAAA